MTAWWSHLSYSQAAMVALSVVIAIAILVAAIVSHRVGAAIERDLDVTPWPVIDYSAQRQKQIDWLGDRWLLAKPINRRTRRQNVTTFRPKKTQRV